MQPSPRRPTAAEWDCADPSGAVVCVDRGGDDVGGGPDGGWRCGSTPAGLRVCVDEAPDLPDGERDGWRCRFESDGPTTRVCERAPPAGRLGAACDARRPCQDGLACREGRCARPRAVAECWLDADCASGPCRSGACRDAPTGAGPRTAASAGAGTAASARGDGTTGTAGAASAATATDATPAASAHREAPDPGVPWLRVVVDPPRAGFGARFSVRTAPGCAEAEAGTVTFTLAAGHRLLDVTTESGVFRARWPEAAALMDARAEPGLLALSPRQVGATLLTVTWQGPTSASWQRRVPLAATATARGLTSVPLHAPVWLSGAWSVRSAPEGARADALTAVGHAAPSASTLGAPSGLGAAPGAARGLTTLTPDASGRWLLAGPGGRTLPLQVGRWDAAPLDCERCHADAARDRARSAMAAALTRPLAAGAAPDFPGCALGCHAVGEPGVEDGGFHHALALRGLDASALSGATPTDLPAELHRVGGVGCQACHGPGTIPEPEGRAGAGAAPLRQTAVCATCHDAPPRYGQVQAFAATAMARAGLSCITCHDPHGGPPGTVAQLRVPPLPAWLAGQPVGPRSAVCVGCHDGASSAVALGGPSAAAVPALPGARATTPAALFWAGRAPGLASGGATLVAAAPHAGVECVQCHRGGPSDVERGAPHGFRAEPTACLPCHAVGPPGDSGLRARAEARWAALTGSAWAPPTGAAAHIDGAAAPAATPEERDAVAGLRLLLADRGAWAHGAPLARALAERAGVATTP